MRVSIDKLQTLFKKIQQLKDHQRQYHLDPDRTPVSIDDLIWVVKDAYGVDIEIFEVDFDASHVRGYLERGKEKACIYLREDQSDFYKRVTITKELVHIVLDEEEDWSVDALNTLQGLLVSYVIGDEDEDNGEHDGPIISERLAVIGAAEILFPRDLRAASQRELNGGRTIKAIALDFNIPDEMASWVLSERYTELVDTVWETLDD
tara:strand:- start:3868 stop:4485 length:618 start_codon:yes stop_codon:yes gene_type:complete